MTTSHTTDMQHRTLHTRAAGLHVREADPAAAEPSRTIAGRAIVFGVPSAPLWSDDAGDIVEVIAPEAVTRELLDSCDIRFTMFHDRQLILARSVGGAGTLRYSVDAEGVAFEFEAPHTADGDKALELVRRGDLAGCSFAFTTRYFDPDCVERSYATGADGRETCTCTVRHIIGIHDFTLAADPAYPATSVEARELAGALRAAAQQPEPTPAPDPHAIAQALREAADKPIF